LAKQFTTVRYDRRGYGESERPACSLTEHVTDLLKLLRTLGHRRVTLVGSSIGALIAFRATLEDPQLIRRVIAHEPPLLSMLEHQPKHQALWERVVARLNDTLDAVRAGDFVLAAQRYVEGVASVPGAWQHLPESMKQDFVRNAAAFLAETGEAQRLTLKLDEFGPLMDRFVLTRGEWSSPFLTEIATELGNALPGIKTYLFRGAGHVPHQSCPADFVERTAHFATEP
jgi:pimeloyl-ACP methyl ester carboxylesterase